MVVTGVLLHYLGWSSQYDEVIDINSQRLASYRFYTKRNDIPHYDLCEDNEEHLHSYVVAGHPSEIWMHPPVDQDSIMMSIGDENFEETIHFNSHLGHHNGGGINW